NKLILVTILLTVIIIISFIFIERYFHNKIKETRIDQYNKQQTLIAVQTASLLKDFIEHLKFELEAFSLSSSIDELYNVDQDAFSNYHKSLAGSIISEIKLDENGKIKESSGEGLICIFQDCSNQDFFNVPKVTRESYTTRLNDIQNKSLLVISVPIYKDVTYGEKTQALFDGVIMVVLDIDLMNELFLDQIKIGLNGYVWALSNDGTLLTQPRESWKIIEKGENYFTWVKRDYPKNSDNINKMIVEETGLFVDNWGKNGKSITAYSHSFFGAESWIIAVTVPFSELEEGINSLQQKMLYFLSVMVSLLSLFFIFVLMMLNSKEKAEQQLEKAEITLEKLGIKAYHESSDLPELDIELKGNKIYLLKEKYDKYAIELFVNLLNKKFTGLAITRDKPEEIKRNYKLEKTPFIWLKKPKDKSDKLAISDTKSLFKLINEFLTKSKKSVILIDRLDYIITQNGFENSLNFIQSLKDILTEDSLIIISINPYTLNESQLNLIEEESQDLSKLLKQEKPKLPKDIYEILQFINNESIQNKKVFFKNISSQFNITKPTTKKKLNELLDLKFIEVEQHGRVKSIKITEKGINFLSEFT
ncbi:MAG: DUF835 domain-containing protein, partial [Nanoarchaeota archaeon]